VKVSGSILRVAEFTLLLIETIRRRAEKLVFHGIKVSFLSFVAGIGRKSIRFTNAEGKEQRAKSKEQGGQRAEGREQK
jgi:hypothetical protein